MTYFTSWDVNVFLCLVTLGVPDDLVTTWMKRIKKTHEEFSLDESKSYWVKNSSKFHNVRNIIRLNVLLHYENMKSEFRKKWKWCWPEKRRYFIVKWTRSEWDWNRECTVWEKEPYTDRGEGKSRTGYWNSGEAWRYSIKEWDDIYESSDNDSDEELTLEYEHDNTWERYRRLYVSQWYENIHEGRYFLFFKENDLLSDKEWDKYRNRSCILKCAGDVGPRWQVAQDLLTIDGPGIGEPPGSKVEHIDDMFS